MRRARSLRAAIAAVMLVGGAASVAVVTAAPEPAHAATSRAVVVVGTTPRVVTFSGTITGIQALRKVASVSTIGFGGLGEAVCAIDGVGNPATPSECLTGPGGQYWAYFRAAPGASGWTYSGQGAGATSVGDGWVEGWRYGVGTPPPFSSFCAVAGCPPPGSPSGAAPTPGGATSSPGAPGAGGSGGSGTTTSAAGPDPGGAGTDRADEGDRERDDGTAVRGSASSRGDAGGDGGGGSPWGVVAGGIVVAGLGAGGWWIRRSRRAAGV